MRVRKVIRISFLRNYRKMPRLFLCFGEIQHFTHKPSRFSRDLYTLQKFVSLMIGPDLFRVHPVYIHDVTAQDAPFPDFLAETLHEMEGAGPHLHTSLSLPIHSAVTQTQRRESPDDGATDLPMSSKAPAENVHGLDEVRLLHPQFFLPDRKNGLTSVVVCLEKFPGLLLHLLRCHTTPPPMPKHL